MTPIDLTPYLVGSGRPVGMSHSFSTDNIHQVVPGPLPDQWLLAKGHLAAPCRFEESRIVTRGGQRYFARGWDTSDRPNVYRLFEGALPVSPWCPLNAAPGAWFRREATVERFSYASGARISGPDKHVTWLQVKDAVNGWQHKNGPVFGKVVILTVHDGEDGRSRPPFETYVFAERYGMVYWKDHGDGRESWANNVLWPDGEPRLTAEPLPKGHAFMPLPVAAPVAPPPAAWYWHRPVKAPFVITSPFGERVMPEDWHKPPAEQRTEHHAGTDYTAADWTAYAAREGKVVFAGWDSSGYGNLIKLDHGGGRTSLYAHLESFAVAVQDTVTAGQKIGTIGSTGRSTARHLHWEVRLNNVAYAPAAEMKPHPADSAAPVAPVPEPGIPSPWLTADEIQQAINALRAQRAAIDAQIVIFERALARATA